jgi:hypothetical protein
MIKDYEKFVAHLKRTGREKLLPQVLRELKAEAVREAKRAPRTETVKENPSLLSGKRILKDGTLTDTTGKRALLEIYQKVIG